jgi:uncharacterized alkaline shock family protein YloU
VKILGKVVLALVVAILILEAVLGLLIALKILPREMIEFFFEEYIYSLKGRLATIIGSAILGLVSFFLVYSDLREERERLAISIPNPLGEVKISAEAIETFIRKEVEKMEEVKEIRSRVIAGKKGVQILSRVSILGGRNIPETTDKIQSLIKDSTQNILGIPEIEEIKVFVREITQPKKKEFPQEE